MNETLYHFIIVKFKITKFFPYLHQLIEIIKVLLFINGNFLLLYNNLVVLYCSSQTKWNQSKPCSVKPGGWSYNAPPWTQSKHKECSHRGSWWTLSPKKRYSPSFLISHLSQNSGIEHLPKTIHQCAVWEAFLQLLERSSHGTRASCSPGRKNVSFFDWIRTFCSPSPPRPPPSPRSCSAA